TEPDKENLKLFITPSEQTVTVNSEVTFSVQIENVSDLFAFSGEIVFDSTKVSIPDNPITEGEFWTGDLISTSQNESDRLCIAIGLVQTEEEDGIDGEGILFSFKLIGFALGESDLTFDNLYIINEDGDLVEGFVEMEITNGKIIIQ
ncbi:MAG: hypothetical protein KAW88_06415, partial [Candidatus Cloacimonetes bacterium]|nr:hypothetical protein [Candidatus Cloacimonadota bacterium]